jgi:hypothetical protein
MKGRKYKPAQSTNIKYERYCCAGASSIGACVAESLLASRCEGNEGRYWSNVARNLSRVRMRFTFLLRGPHTILKVTLHLKLIGVATSKNAARWSTLRFPFMPKVGI